MPAPSNDASNTAAATHSSYAKPGRDETPAPVTTQQPLVVMLSRAEHHNALGRVFGTSLTLFTLLALLITLLGLTVGLWFLDNKLVIPPDRLQAVHWVLLFTL